MFDIVHVFPKFSREPGGHPGGSRGTPRAQKSGFGTPGQSLPNFPTSTCFGKVALAHRPAALFFAARKEEVEYMIKGMMWE